VAGHSGELPFPQWVPHRRTPRGDSEGKRHPAHRGVVSTRWILVLRGHHPEQAPTWCELERDGTVLQFLTGQTPWLDAPGDGTLAAYIYARAAGELLELGDSDASDRELRQLARLADALQQRYPRWLVATLRGMRAHLDGRLDDYETYIREGIAVGQGWNEDTAWARTR
jgi:hypothetical protein